MYEYLAPRSMPELLSMLVSCGHSAKVLAGGTELMVNMRQRAIAPSHIVNLKRIPALDSLEKTEDGGVRIGPLVRLIDIERDKRVLTDFTVLANAAHSIASWQIRNMGTIGGNICQWRKCQYFNQSHIDLFMRQSLSPCYAKGGLVCHAAGEDSLFHSLTGAKRCRATCCSDMLPALACAGAEIEISGPSGTGIIPAEDFWPGPEAGVTTLKLGEVVSGIVVPSFPTGTRSLYLKYKRDSRDFPVVSVAARVTFGASQVCTDARIFLGGIAPIPFRAKDSEDLLVGSRLERAEIEAASGLLLSAARTYGISTDFKIAKTRSLLRDALSQLKGMASDPRRVAS